MDSKQYMLPISADEYEKQSLNYTQQALKELKLQMENNVYKQVNKCISAKNSDNSDSDSNSVIEYTTDDNDDNDHNDEDYKDGTARMTKKVKKSNKDITDINITINNEGVPKEYKTKAKTNTRNNTKNTGSARKVIKDTFSNSNSNNPDKIDLTNVEIERYINQTLYKQYHDTLDKYKQTIDKLNRELDEENKKNHYLKLDLNNAICDNIDNKNKVMQLKEELLDKTKIITVQTDTIYKKNIYIIAYKFIMYIQILLIFCLWFFG